MSFVVKNICIDRPVKLDDSGIYKIERLSFSFDGEVDFPFLMGSITDIIPTDILKKSNAKGRYKIIEQPFFNDAGLFKQVVNTGEYGWYFVLLPPGTVFKNLIVQPGDLDMDLYIGGDSNCLLYSFYNSITDKFSVTGKVVQDARGIYSKIKANMDDLELRHYYLKSCLAKTIEPEEYAERVPDLMNMNEAANFLGISVKTLYNWVNAKYIPYTKVGRKNKFRKSDLDQYLEDQTRKPETERRRKRR